MRYEREKGKRQRATGPKTAEEDAAASSSKEREQLKKKAEEERLQAVKPRLLDGRRWPRRTGISTTTTCPMT